MSETGAREDLWAKSGRGQDVGTAGGEATKQECAPNQKGNNGKKGGAR